jgi:nucleotide-binding universal stress UspA family protein
MTHVISCIDGTSVSAAVSDCAAWASLRLGEPLLLHVLEKSEYPDGSNLAGNIGLGSRESLLEELAALDEKRGRLALEQGRLMLEAARARVLADGVADPLCRQYHGSLVDTLVELEEELSLLVMGKHDENLGIHVGSRIETVVRVMHRPILVCPPAFRAPERVMLAFDGSATTRKGVEMVAASPAWVAPIPAPARISASPCPVSPRPRGDRSKRLSCVRRSNSRMWRLRVGWEAPSTRAAPETLPCSVTARKVRISSHSMPFIYA